MFLCASILSNKSLTEEATKCLFRTSLRSTHSTRMSFTVSGHWQVPHSGKSSPVSRKECITVSSSDLSANTNVKGVVRVYTVWPPLLPWRVVTVQSGETVALRQVVWPMWQVSSFRLRNCMCSWVVLDDVLIAMLLTQSHHQHYHQQWKPIKTGQLWVTVWLHGPTNEHDQC